MNCAKKLFHVLGLVLLVQISGCDYEVVRKEEPMVYLRFAEREANGERFRIDNNRIVNVGDTIYFVLNLIDPEGIKWLRLDIERKPDSVVRYASPTETEWKVSQTFNTPDQVILHSQVATVIDKAYIPGRYLVTLTASDGQRQSNINYELSLSDNLFPDIIFLSGFANPTGGRVELPKDSILLFKYSGESRMNMPVDSIRWQLFSPDSSNAFLGGGFHTNVAATQQITDTFNIPLPPRNTQLVYPFDVEVYHQNRTKRYFIDLVVPIYRPQ